MNQVDIVEVLVTGNPLSYAHPGDAGMDLMAAQSVTIGPLQRALVPTGTAIALPVGYMGWLTPRSGLAVKHGISMVNSPGVIDAGYRGEIKVVLWNTDAEHPFDIHIGDRIAQIVFTTHSVAKPLEVQSLPGSLRGTGGFGSTGVSTEQEGQ